MITALSPRAIQVHPANLNEALSFARTGGFDGLEFDPFEVAGLVEADGGSQDASGDYQARLAAAGIRCSMSRRGDCFDNAPVESFFSTLKREMV